MFIMKMPKFVTEASKVEEGKERVSPDIRVASTWLFGGDGRVSIGTQRLRNLHRLKRTRENEKRRSMGGTHPSHPGVSFASFSITSTIPCALSVQVT